MSDTVTTTTIDWRTQVLENDDEHFDRDDVYEFSNGRKFKDTDKSDSGIYN